MHLTSWATISTIRVLGPTDGAGVGAGASAFNISGMIMNWDPSLLRDRSSVVNRPWKATYTGYASLQDRLDF